MSNLTQLAKIIDRRADELAKKKNVVAVAIGKKWRNGKPTEEDAIIVLVEKKQPIEEIDEQDLIPSKVDGIITDVVGKVGQLEAFSFTAKERPAPAGISCGHAMVTAGTIGGYFRDKSDHIVMLSNNHVLAAENKARVGQYIRQPGKYDRGRGIDKIARLKAFKKIYRGRSNVEDSAIASIISTRYIRGGIKTLGKIVGFNLKPTINQKVQKVGRTTEKTTGKIIGLRATVYVRYSMGTVKFKDQILTNAMSRGGDSGSILLDMEKNAVGLLFAGSSTITVHNRIYYPIKTYGLSILKDLSPPKKPVRKPRRKAKKPKRRTRRSRRVRRPRRTRRPRRARRPSRSRRRRSLGGRRSKRRR